MLMSPAARRSVIGSIGYDPNSAPEEKSPGVVKAGRRSGRLSGVPGNQPSIQDDDIVGDSNKRRSRRLKNDDAIIEEDPDDRHVVSPANGNATQNGDALASLAELDADGPPPPAPAQGGWGTSNSQTNNQSNAQSPTAPAAPFGRRQRNNQANREDDVIADLAEIPDVEAEQAEDLTQVVAESTHLRSHTVPELTELDAALQNPRLQSISHTINQSINGFETGECDLSLLLSCLSGPQSVFESDNVWDFDSLMSEIQSEMHAETEGDEVEEEESSKQGAVQTSANGNPKPSPRRQTKLAAT